MANCVLSVLNKENDDDDDDRNSALPTEPSGHSVESDSCGASEIMISWILN